MPGLLDAITKTLANKYKSKSTAVTIGSSRTIHQGPDFFLGVASLHFTTRLLTPQPDERVQRHWTGLTTMNEETPHQNTVHYVMAVHGIGIARRGEQALEVARGLMATHPQAEIDGLHYDELTLGKIVSLGSDHITDALQVPIRIGPQGPRIVVVDGCWSDITEKHRPHTATSVNTWSKALQERLQRRSNLKRMTRLLGDVRKLVLPLEKFLRWQVPDLAKTIFDDFMSDVQVYAEYEQARDEAVERLSGYLEHVTKQHADRYGAETPFTINIAAHSLGTVASLDVLARQALKPESEQATWYQHCQNLITLGSPVDKFLVLWRENYSDYHAITDQSKKIQLWNYCDELDPVGHHLDLLVKLPWAQHFLTCREDEVYTRYAIPGKAHVDYWSDRALTKRIENILAATPEHELSPVDTALPFQAKSYTIALPWPMSSARLASPCCCGGCGTPIILTRYKPLLFQVTISGVP